MTTHTTSRPLIAAASPRTTRRLLWLAAAAGPVYFASSLVQAVARPGFDIRIHPLSQLATGDLGWIQAATFVFAGLGAIALAIGYRRVRPSRRGVPTLLVGFGLGFVVAGLFPMDAQNGFPLDAPAGPVPLSWHAVIHVAAAALSFLALAVACIVLMIRAIRARQIAAAVGHGAVAVALLLPTSPTESSIQIALTGLVAFTWLTVMALRLRAEA